MIDILSLPLRARTTRRALVCTALLSAITFFGCAKKDTAPESSTQKSPVDRGRFLVEVGGCANCHSPSHPGPQAGSDTGRFMSGHPAKDLMGTPPALGNGWAIAASADNTAFAGPWGVTFASNLTPDSATGIGTWDEGRFIQVLHGGMHVPDLRPIQPPMNVQSFRAMSDDDLKAMFAYLRTLQPVSNKVPAYIPRAGMAAMGVPANGAPGAIGAPEGGALPPGAPGVPPGMAPVAPTITRR